MLCVFNLLIKKVLVKADFFVLMNEQNSFKIIREFFVLLELAENLVRSPGKTEFIANVSLYIY